MQALDQTGNMAESAFRLFRFFVQWSDFLRSCCNRAMGDSHLPPESRRKV